MQTKHTELKKSFHWLYVFGIIYLTPQLCLLEETFLHFYLPFTAQNSQTLLAGYEKLQWKLNFFHIHMKMAL